MKHIVLRGMALLMLVASAAGAQSGRIAGAAVRLAVRPDSRLWIEGTSNLRDWSCEAIALDASVEIDNGAATHGPALRGGSELRAVQVRVPVNALKCGRSQMDRIMYKALKADDAPASHDITGHFAVVPNGDDGDYSLSTEGTLRVAGQERAVRIDVDVEMRPDGTLRAQGELPIHMTDYGITPPTAMFGVIRTGDRIVVKFDLLVDRQRTLASAATVEP